MRKRFEVQLQVGQTAIPEVYIDPKSRHALDALLTALQKIYKTPKYNEQVFKILESQIQYKKKKTGRPGMSLWEIFVLSQVRLVLNTDYELLHNLANNHNTLRAIMGVQIQNSFPQMHYNYQTLYDNVNLLNDKMLKELNVVILDFGHKEVFKKKGNTVLRLKTDSFVVESTVHFPTDYNLLWDSLRKSIKTIEKIIKKHEYIKGWRKLNDWLRKLKTLSRELGRASGGGGKNKEERVKKSASSYLDVSKRLLCKIKNDKKSFPKVDISDMMLSMDLDKYLELVEKHIDLVERRILEGEKIEHSEKLFSIFEQYTEWINKGKSGGRIELGKKLSITTDQYNLIVDDEIMTGQQDRDVVIDLADRMLSKGYNIGSWSFDKGYWRRENKELLSLEINKVIMPKLGKRTKSEEVEESSPGFKKLKNKHSAIESNINELEHRGLNKCPDKGYGHFKRYVQAAICAYNLKKIGKEMRRQEKVKQARKKVA